MNRFFALCLVVLGLAALPGCGDGDGEGSVDTGSSAEGQSSTSESSDGQASGASDRPEKGSWGVALAAESESLGVILFDLSGHTLYTFSKDGKGTSNCYGACAETWPPALTEGKPKADGAASPRMIGTAKRRDGTIQLTYAGHPLYTYSRDRSAEINGNGVEAFGGDWHAIRPNGERP